ncbi:hypothetical protein D915_008117 [Fasciola hepatica]|uniref:Uncharacterized protein n=1 Tax=Fasciola hepatica TaxID=6192 RepID=A0A4E0RUN3_FASHE|nr:hypothetical protein D915_008117 [Fasciola hepatica]
MEQRLNVSDKRTGKKTAVNFKFLYGNSATWNKPVPLVFTRLPSGQVVDEAQWFWHHTDCRQGAFVWERAKPETEKMFARSREECWLDSENNLAYTYPTEKTGAAAMQGWADGLTVPSEQEAHQRQFAECKQPSRSTESKSCPENVATLLQPDLYHSGSHASRAPLFTR